MTSCAHHDEVLAMNLAAISGHRRRKINAAIRRAIGRQCRACRQAKESK